MERKNYSFYMPDDFVEKFEKVKAKNDKLEPLSRSQALYYIVSVLAEDIENTEFDAEKLNLK